MGMGRASDVGARGSVAIGLLVLLLLVVLASVATPRADAVDTCVGHPSDPSVVCVRENDALVDVCDRDPDGHRVYARVVDRRSSPGFQSPFYDDNDSSPGCANVPFRTGVLSIAVCVQSEGCSAFKQVTAPDPPAAPPLAPAPPTAPSVTPQTLPQTQAPATLGIADSEADTFATFVNEEPVVRERWSQLNVKHGRVIVPYDVATRQPGLKGYQRRRKFNRWLVAAGAADVDINVGLGPVEQPISVSPDFKESRPARYGQAPGNATYHEAFRAFLKEYGTRVDSFGVWNEPNYRPKKAGKRAELPGSKTGSRRFLDQAGGACGAPKPSAKTCGPRLSALYYRWAGEVCDQLTLEDGGACRPRLIAGEFAGGSEIASYTQQYKRHLGSLRPSIWSVHNYADVIRYQNKEKRGAAELRTFLRELYCTRRASCSPRTRWSSGELWIGATGAYFSLPCGDRQRRKNLNCEPDKKARVFGEYSQCRGARFIRSLASRFPRVKRIYYFTYADRDRARPGVGDGDSGLLDRRTGDGDRRPAYRVVAGADTGCE